MKFKLTLSVDKQIVKKAKKLANKRNSTVSQMFSDFIEESSRIEEKLKGLRPFRAYYGNLSICTGRVPCMCLAVKKVITPYSEKFSICFFKYLLTSAPGHERFLLKAKPSKWINESEFLTQRFE